MSTSDYLKKLEEIKAKAKGTSKEEDDSSSRTVLERIKSKIDGTYDGGIDLPTVKSWFTGSESTIQGLRDYYKANEGKYVTDYGADFTDRITDLKSNADSVGYYLRSHKNEFSDYDSLYKSYSDYRSYLDEVEKQNSSMREFYAQFTNEDEYSKWYEGYKADEEYKKYFENVDADKASQGWQKYLADEEAAKNAPKYDLNNDGKDAWWEKALGYLGGNGGGVVDTTLPNAGGTQTIHDLRADESHKRPNDDWTEEQKNVFGELYSLSPDLAYAFAEETNIRNDKAKEEEALRKIAESATSNFGAGLGHTIGAIATAPLGMADFLSDLAMGNAGRDIVSDGQISPFEYSQAVTGGISEHLNEYGTLDDDLWIVGGKGLGDLYGLGTSIAQSMASAYTFGPGGTLVSYFGQGAASGMEEALSRGATDWQAALYGTTVGAFEGIAESIGIDNLFKLGSATTIKGYLKNILKQAGAEGMEEGLTALLSNIADNAIMQDKSNFNSLVAQYMAQGMSESDAKKKAWMDTVEGIAYDTIAGAVSGGVSGGIHTTAQTIASNIDAKKMYGDGADLVTEALEIDPENAYAQKMQARVDKGKALSGGQINRLVETNENTLVSQDKEKIKSAAEERLTQLGEKGEVSKLAEVITKQTSGEDLTRSEQKIIDNSKYGQRVVNELNPDNIKSGEYSSAWAEKISTNRINTEVYKGEKPQQTLNFDTKSDIITNKESEAISDESTDGVHLRNGSERLGSTDTEESVFDLESSTGTNKGWRKTEVIADSEAARLVNEGREVSVASLGISRGSDKHTVRLVDEGNETASMKQARARAVERGLNVKFFVGDNLVIADKDGKLFAARAYINGSTMLVRADHPYYTSDQLTRHEIGHDMISKGEVNIEDVRKRLKESVGEENVDGIADRYATAYEGTNMSPDEIWEECICDSLGDMNIFASDEIVSKYMSPAMSQVKAATESTAKSPTQTRGSPEGKTSRETARKEKNGKIAKYLPESKVGKSNMGYIRHQLMNLYSGVSNGIADGIAIEQGNKVYIVDSGRENGKLDFGVRRIRTVNDSRLRQDFIRSTNDDTISKGNVSNELLERLGYGKRGDFGRNLRRESGAELQADKGKSQDKQSGISQENADGKRGLNEKFSSPEEAKESGKISDAKFSIEFADDIANKQRKYAEDGLSRISSEELEKAIADTAHMVKEMKPFANILPQDKVGKTLVKNGSYDVSVENTTVCIRTLAYNSFVDMVSEKVGRPLTQMESFLVSQKLYEIAKEPQCLYCYVSLDRKAFNEMVIRYAEQRDEAISAYEAAGKPKIPSEMDKEWSLFKEFLDGRKPTTNMWDRYVGWLKAYNKGEKLVSLADISTEAKRLELVESGGEVASQVKDILKYAQSASWAKKQTQYVAYYDEILKLKPSVIRNLNNHYGMRWYSFSDYSGAFIVENMQQITDAAIRGLKGLSYTKDTDFAEIFAPTGMNINISVYATKTANGYEIDAKQSANIDEAIKLREKYPNVGIVVVATDKGGVEWALAQEWSDVVIPFHTVRTGADVAEFYNWEIFNAEQNDTVTDQNLWDAYVNDVGKKKASKNVYPSEHQNNKETYLSVCEKRGLTPRFKSFLDNPNYMKLVNETRQSEGETSPLKAKFDVNAAERSFDKFVEKGGYYEGWYNDGIDVDGEADIVAEDVRAGRKANEVNYGRQDINFEDVAKGRKTNREHGHASRELDFIDYIDEQAESEGRKRESAKPLSNREILADALESAAQNDIERNKLREYKGKIARIESEQAKLTEIRSKIKELSFAKGPRDTEAIKKLQFEANQAANRINTYDRQLFNLESTAALKGVLQREKELARRKEAQKGKEALAKYREKAAETQRELLTRYQEARKKGIEGRKKTEMRHKIKDVVNELNQYLTKGTKEKHVPIELQKAVAEALDAVNMDTVGAEERIAKLQEELRAAKTLEDMKAITKKIERIQEMGGNLEAKLSRLKTAYDSIINSDDPLVANSHDDVISSSIDKVIEVVGNTPLRDMSLYQLEAVYDMYKMVLASIRNTNKAFKAAKGEEISTIANGVIAELMDKKRKSPYSAKGMQTMSEFDWNNLKPVYAFERIGSANFTKVFKAVRAGEDVWANDMSEAQAFREEQFKKYKYDSWDFNKRYGFTSTSGNHFELSLNQILSLYAFSKREQAGDHLKYGGFVFDGLTEVKEKTKLGTTKTLQLKDATAYNLSEETLAEIIDKLTPEQRAFADAMQDYLSTVMGEKGNEVSLALYDIKLFKEKHYFPLKSAPQYMAKAKEQAQGEVKIKNKGFTKETAPKAKNPIVLSSFMDVWAGHVNEMSMYHAFTLPLEDFYRVYNYHTSADEKMEMVSVGASLENAHGQAAVKYIDQLLKDLNGGARSDPRETLGKALMANFKKAAVLASGSVVVQQPTAMVRAMALVDAKYFAGKKATEGKHKDKWAEVKKYAPIAVIKEMGYFDTGMGKSSVEWLKGEKTFMDKVDDATSKLPALADEVTWVAIWNAVKRETLHTHKNLRPNSEEFLKAVGERFTEVIVKTQVYDSTLSRSANMRSKSALMNMWTSFMAEPTTSINMLQDAFHKGNKKYIVRALGAVYGSVILNSALVSLIYAMRDDDDDETFLEKYLSRFVTEVIDGVNPITYIPFFKDIWSLAQGFDVERADMSLINDVIDSLQQMVKVISKDTSDMDEEELAEHKKALTEAVLSITDNISSLVGVPVKNVRRDLKGIINAIKTIKEDVNGRETTAGSLGDNILEDVKDSVPVWGWLPDEKKSDKLYDAIIKGDTAYIDRLKSGYKDDKAYQSAIRKALRDNDSRIKEAAAARYNGNTAEYMRIAKEIIAEGHFKQDDVVAAVNAEINAMKPDETSTPSNKVTSIFKVDDYYSAIVGRDQATAYVVKEDLIKTDVANGKDRDTAEADFNSRFASYLRDQYEVGNISDYEAQNMLVNYGGKSEEDASSNVQYWDFKKRYPDYDLSEDAVAKYYSDVEPSGISIRVYYDYSKKKAKAQGVDLNGDGKTDSGSKKKEILYIIDSLPITDRQKDVLYFLNGWAKSTIREAPWH